MAIYVTCCIVGVHVKAPLTPFTPLNQPTNQPTTTYHMPQVALVAGVNTALIYEPVLLARKNKLYTQRKYMCVHSEVLCPRHHPSRASN